MNSVVKLAKDFQELKRRSDQAIQSIIDDAPPLNDDCFWGLTRNLAYAIRERKRTGGTVKEAIHNWYIGVSMQQKPWDKWYTLASFLQRYEDISASLHGVCFNLSEVSKGDDGFGDWMDALPLAGEQIIQKIFDDKPSYSIIDRAVASAWGDTLRDVIMEGENHICMRIGDYLTRVFPNAIRDLPEDEEFPPPRERQYTVTWEIDIWATSPEEAARQAREIQLDHDSTANVFKLATEGKTPVTVDLDMDPDWLW